MAARATRSPRSSLIRPELVFANLEGGSQAAVLRALADNVASTGAVSDADELYARLIEREEVGSTAMGGGVAIPHCKLPCLDEVVMAVGVVPDGVDLEAPDEEAVRLLFVVLSPEEAPTDHLRCLATISRWIRQKEKLEELKKVGSNEEIYRCLNGEEGAMPPS